MNEQGDTIPTVSYFANTPIDPTGETSARVFNGFAMLTLGKNTLHEAFYELDKSGDAILKWHQ